MQNITRLEGMKCQYFLWLPFDAVLILFFQNSLTKPPEDIDSPGRSGARMMMSMDKKYFIKTLVSEEVEQLHLILKQYHQVYTALG